MKIKYALVDEKGAFSFFSGVVFRQEQNSRVTFYSELKNLDTGMEEYDEQEIDVGNEFFGASIEEYKIKRLNRFYWMAGLGRNFGKHLYADIEVVIPFKKNELFYSRRPSRGLPLTYQTKFRDPTFCLKVGCWL